MKKRRFWNTIWTTSLFSVSVLVSLIQPSTATAVNIVCKTSDSLSIIFATSAEESSTKGLIIFSFLPKYFTHRSAIQNCQNTAKTLEELYRKDDAKYFTADKLNGQSVVCAVERRGIGCTHDSAQVLFTFSSKANPSQALYEMLGNDFKQPQPLSARTVSRIYSEIKPRKFHWWLFIIGNHMPVELTSYNSFLLIALPDNLASV